MSRSKEYKAIKNYIHNELGLTIEQLIEIMWIISLAIKILMSFQEQ